MTRATVVSLSLFLPAVAGVASAPLATAAPTLRAPVCTASPAAVDFNGDGCGDLVVGTPGEANGRGAVNVFYGNASGFDAFAPAGARQQWTQDTPGIYCVSARGDLFGAATATGDFNGDGYTDLAIGAPSKTVAGTRNAGTVNVLYGGPNGLKSAGNACLYEPLGGTATSFPRRTDSFFGTTLASGDFNGDGKDDLAVGVPGLSVTGLRDAGGVQLLRGTPTGLSWSTAFTQNTPNVAGRPGAGFAFGFSLAAGRLGTAPLDDLAVGAPGEIVAGRVDVGTVNLFGGVASSALLSMQSHSYSEATVNYGSSVTPGARDSFGWSIAIGDINNDGAGDLAVGVPGKVGLNQEFAGAVMWNPGLGSFVSRSGSMFNSETPGVAGSSRQNDEFGHTVAILPVDAVGASAENALLVAVPYEPVTGVSEAGTLHVIPINATPGAGPAFSAERKLSLSSSVCAGCAPSRSAWFGITVAASDFDGNGIPSLVVGSPGEDVGSVAAAGAMTVMPDDSATTIGYAAPTGALHLVQDSPGVVGASQTGDFFGAALSPP